MRTQDSQITRMNLFETQSYFSFYARMSVYSSELKKYTAVRTSCSDCELMNIDVRLNYEEENI